MTIDPSQILGLSLFPRQIVLEELRIEIERMPFATPSTQIEIVDLSQHDFSTAVVSQGLKLASKGKRVLVVQLLKGGIAQGSDRPMHLAQNLDWVRCNLYRQITASDLNELELASIQQLWQHLRSSSDSGQYDALIVEDLGRAIDLGAIDLADAIDWLNRIPSEISVLLAGKNHPPEFQGIDRPESV